MSTPPAPQPQVTNPMHTMLTTLYASIQRDEPTMANALQNACQQMGSGTVWFGSAADGWTAQLTGYSGDLANCIRTAVDEVASALASTPATCTPGEAKAMEMILSGRLS